MSCHTSVHRVIQTVVPSVVYSVLHTDSCGCSGAVVTSVVVGSVVVGVSVFASRVTGESSGLIGCCAELPLVCSCMV